MTAQPNTDLDQQVRSFASASHGCLVDGEIVYSGNGRPAIEIRDPATDAVIGAVEGGDAEDVDVAVRSASQAFADRRWRGLSPDERARVIWRLADLVERDADLLARLETLDVGTPITQTVNSPRSAARTLRYYAGWTDKITGTVNPVGGGLVSYSQREPVGVVAGIGAWNSPLVIAASKSAPALAAGNSTVLKPAEQAPLSSLWFGNLALEAGVPPGVVNVVTGTGLECGVPLVQHAHVSLVSFTGSVPVGQDIHRRASESLKGVVLELGGKSPYIVFADADVEEAAKVTVRSMKSNAGQVCYTGSRVLVHTSIKDRFLARVSKELAALRMGEGRDNRTDVGPVVSRAQQERVESFITSARVDGCEILTHPEPAPASGYFVAPTVVTGVRNDMYVAREEIFGPVVGVIEFTDEDEAVRVANDTSYGLAAGVWTSNVSRAHRVADQLRAGTVWINTYGVLDRAAPTGGFKLSGVGREHGSAWIDHHTEWRTVYVALNENQTGPVTLDEHGIAQEKRAEHGG